MNSTDLKANPRITTFIGGQSGDWAVRSQRTITGAALDPVARISMETGTLIRQEDAVWVLRGVATNDRYTTSSEKRELVDKQVPIGRPEATRSALILLRKSPDWWGLSQDERRQILEEQSHHISIGLRYLPAIARKLLHCRDMETSEPFDFLGFLDYAPSDEPAFDEMLEQLRSTREWTFIEREIDIRLTKGVELSDAG